MIFVQKFINDISACFHRKYTFLGYNKYAEGEVPKLIFMVVQCLPQHCIIKSPIIPISWQMSSLNGAHLFYIDKGKFGALRVNIINQYT